MTLVRRYSTIFIAILLIAAPLAGTSVQSATATTGTTNGTAGEPTVTTTIDRHSPTSDKVTITSKFNIPAGMDRFYVYMSKTDAITFNKNKSTGFEKQEYPENPDIVRYAPTTTNTPTLSLTVNVAKQSSGNSALGFGSGDGWMLGHTPYMEAIWWNGATDEWEHRDVFKDTWDASESKIASTGYVGDSVFYIGEYKTHRTTASGQTFTFIVPETTNIPAGISNAMKSVSMAADDYDTGYRVPEITIIAKPGDGGGGFTYLNSGESVVHHGAPVSHSGNVWVHEYIHTRQTYSTSSEMKWIIEGSAEYHTTKLMYVNGFISKNSAKTSLSTVNHYGDDTLSKPSTWEGGLTQYEKGSIVLAALDAKIMKETDGKKSLEDVMRKLNQDGSKVTYERFKETVNRVSGANLSPWLDQHIRSNEKPTLGNWAETVEKYQEIKSANTEKKNVKTVRVLPEKETATALSNSSYWGQFPEVERMTETAN